MKDQVVLKHNNNFNLIRTIAALQVLIVHSFNHFELENMFVDMLKVFPGVPIFFFLSGYLISKSYQNKKQKSILPFFKNRLLRIYPALIVCVILSVIMVFCTGYLFEVTFSIQKMIVWIVAQLTFFQNYNVDFMRGFGVGVLNGALWTIAVELQFYALTPIFFFIFKKNKFILYTLFLISLAANIYIKLYYDWDNVYFKLFYSSSIPWVFMFLLGFLFCQFPKLVEFAKKQNIFILLILYLLSINFIGNYTHNTSNAINPISVFILAFLLVKLAFMNLHLNKSVQNFLNTYDISYGLYIYHMPVINLFLYLNLFNGIYNVIFVFSITVCCSFLSWLFVERKFLKLKQK